MTEDEKYVLVKQIFIEVVELPLAEQKDYIKERSAGDEEVYKEVVALLDNNNTATIIDASPSKALKIFDPNKGITSLVKSKTAGFLTRIFQSTNQLRLWSLVVFVFLSFVGVWAYQSIEKSVRLSKKEELKTLLKADILALDFWVNQSKKELVSLANDSRIRKEALKLVAYGQGAAATNKVIQDDPVQKELHELLSPYLEMNSVRGYSFTDRTATIFASSNKSAIGTVLNAKGQAYISKSIAGETQFSAPTVSKDWVDVSDSTKNEIPPVIWFDTPIYDDLGNAVATLAMGSYASFEFEKILSVARMGKSGETYAFNDKGMMLSGSRFFKVLKNTGLLLDAKDSTTMLNLILKDPQKNVLRSSTTLKELDDKPLTEIVQNAITGKDKNLKPVHEGIIMHAYNDYRGVKVIGAWQWLPEYNMGLITEVDFQEAFLPLMYLKIAFFVIYGLLIVFVSYSVFSSFSIVKLNKKVSDAEHLGQYTLVKKIGEGGMGEVYLAQHAMLKRPTVVKFLKKEITNSGNLERFEKEVQLASQLTHPNTIKIYDYGSTPKGVFYYAMEYLEGFHLADLIKMEGKVPYERTLYIVEQVCKSLGEAHAQSIIHRDIKPMNIMLCYIGRQFDFVKVLDFGLVKDLNEEDTEMTRLNQITGTPVYMAPERITEPNNIDARVDIYALGVVAYNMLTGRKLFQQNEEGDLIYHALNTEPTPIQDYAPEVPYEVCQLIEQCLEKNPVDRPTSVGQILDRIHAFKDLNVWSENDARIWWKHNF